MPSLPPSLPTLQSSDLPAADPPSSPRRLIRSVVNSLGAVVKAVSSPFRRAPVDTVDASPSTSIALSTITAPDATGTRESNESIRQQAVLLYATTGAGNDSDEEGEEVDAHTPAFRTHAFLASEFEEDNPLDIEDNGEEIHPIPGAPINWTAPVPPPTFKGYDPKPNSGAPATFEEVDNPGAWTDYMFQPKYDKGQYKGHFTPTGAKVVPPNGPEGKRSINGWDFHYNGWTPDEFSQGTYVRFPATAENIKPPERVCHLNTELLKKHGINTNTMNSPIHFYQLLLPICDPTKSGIVDDGRMPFYTIATRCTNLYAVGELGWGSGGYSHEYHPVSEKELVRWSAVPIRHGARGGSPMKLHYRWMTNDEDYDSKIAGAMNLSRWRQIKSTFKLNNNIAEPKRGMEGYDPANKYRLLYDAMTYNMNYFTEKAEEDFGIDESTWGFMGFSGDCGGRLKNKMVSKGKYFIFIVTTPLQVCSIQCHILLCNRNRWTNNIRVRFKVQISTSSSSPS